MPKYKQQKVTIEVPKDYTEVERRAIATEIIDFIVERTQSGKDKNGKSFKGYSKGYKESLDFKNAGKNPSKVDLTLTEEMLNELKLIKTTRGKIELGYDGRRNKLNGKVEGNILGTYGQKKSTGKSRDFLGISKRQLDNILKNYPLLKEEERIARILQVATATEAGERILSESQITDLRDKLNEED